MIKQCSGLGHKVLVQHYFARRGDFAENKYSETPPEYFYEWILVIEKGSDKHDFSPFSSDYSDTFLKFVVNNEDFNGALDLEDLTS